MKFRHEFTERGSHRIVMHPDTAGNITGEYAPYGGIAQLAHGGNLYLAVTEYHLGGVMVPGVVYRATTEEAPK